jgi:hypothetical protein
VCVDLARDSVVAGGLERAACPLPGAAALASALARPHAALRRTSPGDAEALQAMLPCLLAWQSW